MIEMTQAQLANQCRLLTSALVAESRVHERGTRLRADLLHTAAQLARLAQDQLDGLTLDPISVSVYCDSSLDLISAAFGLRLDRYNAKVSANG